MLFFEILLIIIALYVAVSLVYYTLILGISPIPTSSEVRQHLFAIAQKQVTNHSIKNIAELGSGWGTLAIPLAKKFPNVTIYAFEASSIPYWFTKVRLWISPQDNLVLQRKNFYEIPLSDFDMIVCYLYPKAMKKLHSKFEQELKKQTIIITHTFSIHEWKAAEIVKVNDLHRTKIFVYKCTKRYE